jgi:hypothetical protein
MANQWGVKVLLVLLVLVLLVLLVLVLVKVLTKVPCRFPLPAAEAAVVRAISLWAAVVLVGRRRSRLARPWRRVQ